MARTVSQWPRSGRDVAQEPGRAGDRGHQQVQGAVAVEVAARPGRGHVPAPQKPGLAAETSRNLPVPSLANSWFRSA